VDVRDRFISFVKALPVAHRVGIATALVALAMLGTLFVRWVTTPTYTVLYTGLDDQAVSTVIDELETNGVPYTLESGGSTVMVPQDRLYETRASLASAGVSGKTTPPGWELLDDQGLSVSDFRQRVDYQRALEGELSKTLMAMNGIDSATVHVVLPEEELFAERQEPATASVLLGTTRQLTESEVEAVTFLVSSSVEQLAPGQITVADAEGNVLHAPGDVGGSSVATNRNMRQTHEFEQQLAGDISRLLEQAAGGTPASVVVRATLNYDESERREERYNGDSQVALKEQTAEERFEGAGVAPGGAVGIDGGPLQVDGQESNYERDEALREFGVDKTTVRTVAAPGTVERLSVAIVMDDGSLTGAQVPPDAEIEQLVSAALGMSEERGDDIAVYTIPFPAVAEDEPEPEPGNRIVDLLPQILGALVLLIVAVGLFLMTRRRAVVEEAEPDWEPEPEDLPVVEAPSIEQRPRPEPVEAETAALQSDVTELIERQPEEIATLLRSWLADRRAEPR
jgi:flagellar M-ring protein FliF